MKWNTRIGSVCIAMVATFLTIDNLSLRAGKPVFVGNAKAKLIPLADIDHADWNDLLSRYVDDNGRVKYKQWKASSQDRQQLDRYLRHLSTASISAGGEGQVADKMAFWINAYNAVTVKGILREYPTTSIRNHTPRLWGYHIWQDLQLHVGHQPYSLEQIEHEVLRKMGDPRIHFAIVCASISCPRLLNEAYVPDRLDQQLTGNAKDFFSRQQNFRYDATGKRFYLSAILNWFGEDFGSSTDAVLKRIAKWLPDTTAQNAANQGQASVSYIDYDWNLNERR